MANKTTHAHYKYCDWNNQAHVIRFIWAVKILLNRCMWSPAYVNTLTCLHYDGNCCIDITPEICLEEIHKQKQLKATIKDITHD